jgi:hypothetical protein
MDLQANRELILELYSVHQEAFEWGQRNGWPLPEKYPQFNKIREIGKNIYEIGGLRGMEQVGQAVIMQCLKTRGTGFNIMIGYAWQRIGGWQP